MFEKIRADIARFQPENPAEHSTGNTVRGLLSQGFHALATYRFFSWCQENGIPTQPVRFVIERAIEITTGIQIPASCRIGPGMRIHHFGGIIFHPSVQVGKNFTLYHGVTIGDRGGTGDAAKLGDDVLIGAGAKLIGELSVGDGARIAANCVVRKDVPAHHLAFGNPSQLKPLRSAEAAHAD